MFYFNPLECIRIFIVVAFKKRWERHKEFKIIWLKISKNKIYK